MGGMTADARDRSAARIRPLARRGLDVASFWRECNEVLSTTVPHYLAPCWFTFDPASLLVTSHYDPVIPEISAGFLAHEYLHDDVLKMGDVAVSGSGVATIHEVTGGDPGRSPGWRDAEYEDLGTDYYEQRANIRREVRNHARAIERRGYRVILEPIDPGLDPDILPVTKAS